GIKAYQLAVRRGYLKALAQPGWRQGANGFTLRARSLGFVSQGQESSVGRSVAISLALDMLEAAYLEGFIDVDQLQRAKELEPLKQEPRYKELLKHIRLDLSV